MSKIDLSKAKIGDMFRTKLGYVVIFTGLYPRAKKYKYMFERMDDRCCGCCCDINGVPFGNEEIYTIVEQVFDKPLDAIERDMRINFEMAKAVEVIKEEKQELQRRQEVIALAEKLVVNEEMMKAHKDLFEEEVYAHAKTPTTYPAFVIRSAEDFIKHKNQYLKDGKLC